MVRRLFLLAGCSMSDSLDLPVAASSPPLDVCFATSVSRMCCQKLAESCRLKRATLRSAGRDRLLQRTGSKSSVWRVNRHSTACITSANRLLGGEGNG